MKRPPERRLRVYQQWQGNERFFCWGHCVTGPSWKSGLGSLVLLIAPTVIFLVFVAPYMADRVSPAILSISCVLPLFCLAMLLLTACRDPGVLPRQEPDEEWLQGRKPRAKDVCVNGQRVTVRYNDTCHFYQPPRAHHCSVNDNCIERFDHHCPWVGTTIGKRNYRTFLLFIYGTSAYIAWTFGVSLGSLFVRHGELVAAQQAAGGSSGADSNSSNLWLQALSQSGASIALMIFTFIFFWFVCGLSGFHTWLVATNQTTYENFRYNHNQVPNPYNEGCLRNCASVWCRPIPPSKVQFRAFIDEAVKQPVELGFPEWSGGGSNASPVAAPPPPAGSGIGGGGTLRSEPVGMLAAGAGGGVAQVLELNGGGSKPSLLGRGGTHVATVPIQGYDSVTEGSAELPISRSEGRSEGRGEIRAASQLAAAGAAGGGALASAGAAAGAAAAASGGGGGWGLPAGRSSPDAVVLAEDAVGIEMASATGGWQQQQQQQQGGSRLAAAGPLVGGMGAQQQQQQHYGSLAPQQQLMQQPGALQQQLQHHQQQQEGHQSNGDLGAVSGRLTEYEDADGSTSEIEGWGPGREGSAGGGGGSMLLSALSGVDAADNGGGLQR